MFDRHMIGDIAIAFLLAVPTVALSRPQPSVADNPEVVSPLSDKASFADSETVEKLTDPQDAAND